MNIETMKQWLEALKLSALTVDNFDVQRKVQDAIASMGTAIERADKQEPVAWRWIPSKVWQDYVLSDDPKKAALAREHGIEVEALCKCDTPPAAQRQWVGLTDEEQDEIAAYHGLDCMAYETAFRTIEAKLKEKNT